MMFGKKDVPDKALIKTVNQRLVRTGTGKVTASAQRGVITLTGQLQYDNQRTPILKAVRNIAGVKQVIDQLQAPPKRSQ